MNSFQVYTDENQGVQTRAKRADGQAAQKRTALGQLTNVRQQPARAAKSAPFKVYEDTGRVSAPKDDEKRLKLVRKAPAPAPVFHPSDGYLEKLVEDITADSPMALDISCMDTDDSVRPVVDTATSSVDRETSLYCLPEYRDDIIEYLKEAETRCRPKVSYMRKQTDISPQMRTILVDWLVEVCEEYKLHDETLHLAVNYIDRFLSQMSVLRGKLQLVGTACIYLASKFEEIYPPDVGEFVYITDDTYTKRQLLRMEHLVIKVLGFECAVPTANVFADIYFQKLGDHELARHLVQYIMELSLLDCDNYLQYKPSVITSAAMILAAHILADHKPLLSVSDMEKVTGRSQEELTPVLNKLLQTLRVAPDQPQQAVRDKYKADSRRAVSTLPIPLHIGHLQGSSFVSISS